MMITMIASTLSPWPRLLRLALAALAALALSAPVAAQDLETFDPDQAYTTQGQAAPQGGIDGDLVAPGAQGSAPLDQPPADSADRADRADRAEPAFDSEFSDYAAAPADAAAAVPQQQPGGPAPAANGASTYGQDDLIGAAEGVFGKGAEGLAKLIEDLLKKQGEPVGYIVGREAGGAFIVGARYGSGTLHHKVEGAQKVYWTGPSIGFDAGASAANTFVLVYNLHDTEELFKRYPAGEGQAYFIGGLHASYLRRGDVVLIPIRVGAGVRLGVNAGYMRFSRKQRWSPF